MKINRFNLTFSNNFIFAELILCSIILMNDNSILQRTITAYPSRQLKYFTVIKVGCRLPSWCRLDAIHPSGKENSLSWRKCAFFYNWIDVYGFGWLSSVVFGARLVGVTSEIRVKMFFFIVITSPDQWFVMVE